MNARDYTRPYASVGCAMKHLLPGPGNLNVGETIHPSMYKEKS